MAEWQERVNTLIEQVKDWRQAVLKTPPDQVLSSPLSQRLSEALDGFIREIYALAWERTMERVGQHYIPHHSEIALMATGGYGRRELCPFSDIDIAFVPLEEDDPFVDELVRQCFRLLVRVFIDNTDLKVGYGYRPLSDLPTLDTQTQAALMDARFIAGYEPLAHRLHQELLQNLDVLQFIRERERERLAAYQRFHSSPLVTEPHLKEGAGGLRDGHTVLWLLAAIHRVPTTEAWQHLATLLPEREWQAFCEGYQLLQQVRFWLHLTAQRRQEVLLKEYHHRIATTWFPDIEGEERRVRMFHHQLYEAMESLHFTLRQVQLQVKGIEISLKDGFVCLGNRLSLSSPPPSDNPLWVMKAFELMQRYDLEPDQRMVRWLREHAPQVAAVRASPEAAQAFLTVLTGAGEAPFGKVLDWMVVTGVLENYLPEWKAAAHYVPTNAAHRFTVGEHVLATVRELARLREAAWRGEFPWSDVLSGVSDEGVLFLAALLHDLGKVVDEREHEQIGVRLARQVSERLGLSEDRIALLERLVQHHMLLLSTARLRDIFAPETLRSCAEIIGDEGLLKMLLLHSFADARSVSEQTFTEVEERMLLDLYFGVLRVLQEEAAQAAPVQTLARVRIRELRQTLSDLSDEEVRQFCEAMPPSYLLSTPLSTVAVHCRMVQQVRQTGEPSVEVLQEPDSGFTEIVVCAPDAPQPGMLSQIAGALFACDVDIRNARVFTIPGDPPLVLDTLWVTSEGRPLSDAKAQRVRETLFAILKGKETVSAVLERYGKPRMVPVQVRSINARNDLSETHTVLHIVARDRKGLLYRLTREIAALGLDVQTAKIVTWGDTAEDAFYVVRKGAGKVPEEELSSLVAQLWAHLQQGESPNQR